jgi:uncharacterized membrane protein
MERNKEYNQMTKINWPRVAALVAIVSLVVFSVLAWLWYFAGNDYIGMMGGLGFMSFGWSNLIVLGLMHLSFWVLFVAGNVLLVQAIRANPNER